MSVTGARSAPTNQNQVSVSGNFRQPMQFPIHCPALSVLLPQPTQAFLNHRFAIPVASDPECISQYAWAPDINALALVGALILNSNLKHNHLLSHD
jgi:hypothetical protein